MSSLVLTRIAKLYLGFESHMRIPFSVPHKVPHRQKSASMRRAAERTILTNMVILIYIYLVAEREESQILR